MKTGISLPVTIEINSLQRANEQLLPEAKIYLVLIGLISVMEVVSQEKLFGYYAKHSRRNGFE